ncbi:MAG: putative toxin-antitoxin system toxin component, PIN family [Candidatus Aminicenantes bacterium]|nr:putative toxin-antitoxin system toxin component, PIN family [Candidatus Aminicenantes bacterium]
MKVVADTNVFVSSFFGGNPRKIIELWKSGSLSLCLSPEILEEYFKVLRRMGLEDESDFKELLDLFSKAPNVLFAAKTSEVHAVPGDPDDDKFIACAIALGADVIITGDKALESVRSYNNIRIMTPARLLGEFKPK